MTSAQIEIQLIAAVVAAACALPGTFLVLRRMAMMSDAISHTVLLGIVLMFFVVGTLDSPLLILGAAVVGVLTVSLVELLNSTRLVKEDAAIGLVFPALFSVAVILISRFAEGVHLDADAVLLGELAFAPFDRLSLLGLDLPRGLVVMSFILLLNLIFILFFYKELKLATFDAGLSLALGFSPVIIHYLLMTLVSVTAVGAFDSVGSILVVAMMIGPPATAYLLTDRLSRMLIWSVVIGVASAISGYWLARLLDANIAGAMSTMIGLAMLLAFLFAPQRGMLALAIRRSRQKWVFAQWMLTIHLYHHEETPHAIEESEIIHLQEHLRWSQSFARKVVALALESGLVTEKEQVLYLTNKGRQAAREQLAQT